jgi:hypothetical protein
VPPSECQNDVQLANLADDPGQTATPPPTARAADPPPGGPNRLAAPPFGWKAGLFPAAAGSIIVSPIADDMIVYIFRVLYGVAMLTALILICSIAITPDVRDCTRDSARVVMRLPERAGNPAMCFMLGQAYLAETSIGQSLENDDVVKVACARAD